LSEAYITGNNRFTVRDYGIQESIGAGEMTISLYFGALCDPINKQLNAQGYGLSEKESELFQEIANAIIMLKLHGIIPSSTVLKAEQKLMKMICSAESLAELTK
jgi:hypothetical protein